MESNSNVEEEVIIDSSQYENDMNKGDIENERKNDSEGGNTEENEKEENEVKEDNGLDKNKKKKA